MKRGDLPASVFPTTKILFHIRFAVASPIRNRQPATSGNTPDWPSYSAGNPNHGLADRTQVRFVRTGANVHVQPDEIEAVLIDQRKHGRQVFMPDAVLAVRAASVGLAAMAMTKPRIDA